MLLTSMKIALSYSEYFERISELYEKLSALCPVFNKFAHLYPSSVDLQRAVEGFCIITIEVSTATIEFLNRKSRILVLPHLTESY